MVLTISLLTQRDANLAIIWKLATTSNSKLAKIRKNNILFHNVQDTCRKIIVLMEENSRAVDKCSLYLLSQLMYGTLIIYAKQVTFLSEDVMSLRIKLVPVNLKAVSEMALTTAKKGTRRKSRDNEEGGTAKKRSKRESLDIEDYDFGDQTVGTARHEEITLKEFSTPMAKDFPTNDLPMVDDDEYRVYDTFLEPSNERRDSGNIRNWESFGQENISFPKMPVIDELPIQAPNEEDIRQSQTTPRKIYSQEFPHSPAQGLSDILSGRFEAPRSMSIEFNDEVRDMMPDPLTNTGMEVSHDLNRPFEIPDIRMDIELDELDQLSFSRRTPFKTPTKTKRLERNQTQITHASMREMEQDYSSLIHKSDDLIAVIKSKNDLTLKMLMDPSPYYRLRKRFAPHLRTLYRIDDETRGISKKFGTEVAEEEEDELNSKSRESKENSVPYENIELDALHFTTPMRRISKESPLKEVENTIKEIDFEQPRNSTSNFQQELDFEINNSQMNTTRLNFDMFKSPKSGYNDKEGPEMSVSEIKNEILSKCEAQAPYPVKFDQVVSINDGRRAASRKFYSLLEMIKERTIRVEQEKPFDVIEMSLVNPESVDLEDIVSSETVANQGFIKSQSSKSSGK